MLLFQDGNVFLERIFYCTLSFIKKISSRQCVNLYLLSQIPNIYCLVITVYSSSYIARYARVIIVGF